MEKVLFVCLGNICRSPAGEEILRQLAAKEGLDITVDSCGTGDWHVGQSANERMIKAAGSRGFSLTGKAKQFNTSFFEIFDVILAAETPVYNELHSLALSQAHKDKVVMMTAFSPKYKGQDVPDPYFGGEEHYEETLTILEEVCQDTLDYLKKKS